MGWALAFALCGALAYWCLLLTKELKSLQRWRDDVTRICRQQMRSDDHA